jgi:hypothetical protein
MDKVFPRQAEITTIADWVASLRVPGSEALE